ncbi:MAG TPA: TIM-barrel domain-containing protein [Geodermatophilus sp.]|nr:TIM-barrel domain-containing protein [Geodermatophilus sp.]
MARTYELTPFLGAPQPVELAARLLEARADDRGLTLRCGTDRHEPELQDYYGTVAETVFAPPSPGRDVTVRIDVWTPHVVRVRYLPDGLPRVARGTAEPASPVLTGRPDDDVAFEVREEADRVVLTTGAVELTVVREPLRLELRDRAGALLWATKPVDIANLRRPERQWSPAEQRWLFLHRYAYPLGHARDGGRTVAFGSFDLRHDEHVHGFGEGFGRFDKVGTTQRLWIQEAFSNASPASYKQVPWYWSSRGYGLFVHTTQPLAFRVGDLEHSALSVVVEDTAELDLFVVAAPTAREALPRYTALTGAPAVPPRWSLGLWMSRITYTSQAEVEQVAARLREHRIPCDVIHVDTGWFATDYTCDLTFSPERFPDPAGMCARLAEQGFKVSLWQWPNYNVASPLFDEGVEGGYLARRSSGHTYTYAGGYGEDAGFVDFSHPEAVAWYQGKLAALFDAGVAAIKVDYGEGAPPGARYAHASPTGMRNLYPLLYQEAVWNASVAARGEGEAVLWARAGWAGSQRYPVHWSGDGVARFEDLACVLRATLSMGLSGFPFYAHDIGGFSGLPDGELYVRWAQLGLLSSHARAHGAPPREPWEFGADVEEVVRRFVELRYRLLPYLWTESVAAGRTSLPVVRPLLLEFPDDPVAADVDDQYLLGDRLLVAPVLEEGVRSRRVYLPAGTWVHPFTGVVTEGGGFSTVDAPLDVVPMWVRGDTVLPLGPVRQHVDEQVDGPLVLLLAAPSSSGSYEVDTGAGRVAVAHRTVDDGVEVRVGPVDGPVELVVLGGGAFTRAAGGVLREVPGGVSVAVDAAAGGATVRLSR